MKADRNPKKAPINMPPKLTHMNAAKPFSESTIDIDFSDDNWSDRL
jgi:hypothetical protein